MAHAEKQMLKHGCIIMASGMGTRFGDNKLMADLAGKPLVGHVLDAVDGLFAQCVVVTRHADVAAYCEDRGVRAVLHALPHRDDTVRLGLDALGGCDTVTFFQGDQPLIGRDSIAALLQAAECESDAIWRVSFEGTPGAPMLFPTWAFPELRALPTSKGGGFLAKKYPERVHTVPAQDAFELFDVDTQEDLRVLEEYLAARSR